MDNSKKLEYNLLKISQIDKEIKENNDKKMKLISYNNKRYKVFKFFNKFNSRIFQTIIIVLTTLLMSFMIKDPLYTAIISINIIAFINLIINIMVTIFETSEKYLYELNECNEKHNALMIRRNTYINLYNYALYGDKTIIDNIKLKIKSGNSYDYNYIETLGLSDDSYEVNTLNAMKEKEELMKQSIKNRIYCEMNSPVKTENLSNEELNTISLAL